jgi:hypothetical protein
MGVGDGLGLGLGLGVAEAELDTEGELVARTPQAARITAETAPPATFRNDLRLTRDAGITWLAYRRDGRRAQEPPSGQVAATRSSSSR